jgi:two-component system chemotaxis response regulator CheB
MMDREVVVVGVSAGGLQAVGAILRRLPADLGVALVVVQHRSRESTELCALLQDCTTLPIEEAVDKQPLVAGHVYIAPADYHLLIEPGHLALSCDEPELYSRPSIDLAFETAADSYGPRAVGVVLTGANSDGARGLARIAARGGLAIVQTPATAEVAVMPAAALAAVPGAEVRPLAGIADRLGRLNRPRRPRSEARS